MWPTLVGHTLWRRGPGQDTECLAWARRLQGCGSSIGGVVLALLEALEELLEELLEGRMSCGLAPVGAYGAQWPNWRY